MNRKRKPPKGSDAYTVDEELEKKETKGDGVDPIAREPFVLDDLSTGSSEPMSETERRKYFAKISDEVLGTCLFANHGILSFALGAVRRCCVDWWGEETTHRLRLRRQWLDGRIRRSPMLQKIMEECEEAKVDAAEDIIQLRMRSGDASVSLRAATWYLERKGKGRGYSTRVEVESLTPPSADEAELGDLPPEALANLRKALDSVEAAQKDKGKETLQ